MPAPRGARGVAAMMRVLGQAILAGDTDRATQVARRLQALFPGRFYMELQRAGLPGQEALVQALKRNLGADAVVLVKGSRSSRMENVVNALIEHSEPSQG